MDTNDFFNNNNSNILYFYIPIIGIFLAPKAKNKKLEKQVYYNY